MEEDKFMVLFQKSYSMSGASEVLARDMTLDDALLFIKAYYNQYWKEHAIVLSLRKEEPDIKSPDAIKVPDEEE